MSDFSLLPEQRAIVEEVKLGRTSTMVEAGAGCAKTTTLKAASQGIKVPGLALAFGRKNADDLAAVMPKNISVKSFNALGHGAWVKTLPEGTRVQLDDRKIGKLVTGVCKEWKADPKGDGWDAIRGLVRGAMAAGLVPSPIDAQGLCPDDEATWREIGASQGLDQDELRLWPIAREVLIRSIGLARKGVICFDDQIYCSSMLGGKFWKHPVILVDEDQDLSPLNIRMAGQSLTPGGRLVAVGDKRQAIYAWRGAAGDSAERLRRLAGRWSDLPLMTTFRCPRLVVARQQHHVPGFRAWDGAIDGRVEVVRRPLSGQWAGWNWQTIVAAMPGPRSSIAVVCRNNAPLLKLAMKLIREGVGVHMLGRDIGKGLVGLTDKIAAPQGGELGVDVFCGRVKDWAQAEAAKVAEWPARVDSVWDRAECLLAVASREGIRDVQAVKEQIERIFESEGLVTLSSIHKAKGLEWDFVVLLDPWRIPSKHALLAAENGAPLALEQEYNLRYVAETRTKHTLMLANLKDWAGEGGPED